MKPVPCFMLQLEVIKSAFVCTLDVHVVTKPYTFVFINHVDLIQM